MGISRGMIARHLIRSLAPAVVAASGLTGSALAGSVLPSASAQCPDVQVVFARGTGEAPGVGPTGQAFVDALHSRVGSRSFDGYPVNYPPSDQWATGIDGVRDAGTHVVSMAQQCPNTKMVLGGYSQGAAVMGFVTSPSVPDGIDPNTVPKPLDPSVAQHVSSVVLFGMPNVRAMNFLGEPPVVIGPTFADDAAMIDKGVAFASSLLGVGGPATQVSAPGGNFGG